MEFGTTHHVNPSGRSVTGKASETVNNRWSTEENTVSHRQRSLREIIGDSTHSVTESQSAQKPRHQQLSQSSGSFMNVLLGDIDIEFLQRRSGRNASWQYDTGITPGGDPALVFPKLKPTRMTHVGRGEASSLLKDEIQPWIDQFSDYVSPAMNGEKHMELLFQVHPELTEYQKLKSTTHVSNETKKRRRGWSRTGTVSEQFCLDASSDKQRFFTLMSDWIRRLKIHIRGQPLARHAVLWEKARLCFVAKTLRSVLHELELLPCEHEINQTAPEHFTSGISFVRRSESIQEAVSQIYEPLPPVIIQPPKLQITKTDFTTYSIELIKNSEVLMVRMPNKDDTAVKNYLLEESLRQTMVLTSPGATCRLINGLESISEMISDRTFLCCHYHLDSTGSIQPCTGQRGIDQSNIQVVIIVRKGIGGTCTLKNAARSLNDLQVLPILMGTKSFPELSFNEESVSIPSSGLARRRAVNAVTTPRKTNVAKSLQFCKEVSVRCKRNDKETEIPQAVVKGTVTDWFDSINTTASQIISQIKCPEETPEEADGLKRSPGCGSSSSKKQRASRCGTGGSNPLSKNVKLHTLSCRLELFVEESLWQSLSKTKQDELNSIVIGLEQWLLERIQIWNKERMSQYCQDVISVVQTNMDDLEKDTPKFRNKHILKGQTALDRSLLQEKEVHGLFQFYQGSQDKEVGLEVFGDIPEVPKFCNNFSYNTVKTTVVASGIHRPGLPEIPWPFYLITTRDCFTYDLIQVKCKITSKEDYRFGNNFMDWSLCNAQDQVVQELSEEVPGFPLRPPDGAMPVGVTTYTSLFTSEELNEAEKMADRVHEQAQLGMYPPECFHPTIGRSGGLKRTKYFFGARYLWTKEQLADPNSHVACGVRVDVPSNPAWMKDLIEDPLVHGGIVPHGFINSWALNMYHDGSEGIQSHFDDSSRFCQPIYSLRLFSDSRLSFGTQLYGFTNGAFFVPMPRGCITIMHDKSYAANVVKHCVRPCDMTGKSAGLIMRKINTQAWNEAIDFHLQETTTWLDQMHLDQEYTAHSLTPSPLETKFSKCKTMRPIEINSKADLHTQGEVRNVMESLLKVVIRSLNQETLNGNKLRKIENKEVRQVLDHMIKSLEANEKKQIKDQKQRYQEMSQVKNLMETMVKRIERNFLTSRKRRDHQTSICMTPKSKRSKSLLESRTPPLVLSNESVILAATQIIEKVMGRGNFHVIQTACNLLKKFGSAWLRGDRVGLEQVYLNEEEPLELIDLGKESLEADPPHGGVMSVASEAILDPPVPDQMFQTRPVTRSLYHGLTKQALSSLGGNSMTLVPPQLRLEDFMNCIEKNETTIESKSEEGEEESKKLLNELVEAVLKKAVASNSTPFSPCSPALHLSEDLLKQVAQETDMLDLGLWSDTTSSPSIKTETSKRTYKLVPWGLCFDCEKQGVDPPTDIFIEGALWQCQGPCRRSFHHRCRPQTTNSFNQRCTECIKGTHKCHACGEGASSTLGPVLKCSLGVCGRFYHISCVMSIPATTVLQGNWMPVGSVVGDKSCMKFRCPQHYCQTCGLSGANIYSVTCIRCPAAFHARCKPMGCVQLSKKLILCPKHISESDEVLR
eukprot:g1077.t1